jgi:hypothetical protein
MIIFWCPSKGKFLWRGRPTTAATALAPLAAFAATTAGSID